MIPLHVRPETLSRVRKQLLRYLQHRLSTQERINTTIVFDVHQNKKEIPAEESFASMKIINAVNYPDADTCIEELVLKHSAPKQLIVVSGDHRLHRAAEKRKASSIDSEDFFEILESRPVNFEQITKNKKHKSSSRGATGLDEEKESSPLLESIEYPEEDLPSDVKSPLGEPSQTEDVDFWTKRIDELFDN